MNRLLLLLFMNCFIISARSQSITAAEYFIDTDPGAGNGTAITIPVPGDVVNFTATIPTTSINAGFHFACIRVRDVNGMWGQFEKRGFYISPPVIDATNITAAEYFFDTDPGSGNATAVSVGAVGSVVSFSAVIPTSLPAGFHFLVIRSKDAEGKWGLFEKRGFYINTTTVDLSDIVAAEYFIDADPGVGNGTAITIPSPVSTYTDSLILSLGSLSLGNYRIAIRVKNTAGQWSLMENRPFTVCTTDGSQSEMDYQVEGNKVFFTNNSLYYDTVTWKFGDNTIDTVVHPIKTYAVAGVYNVQLITENSCGIDTLTKAIEIRGLQHVNANRAGNTGISTLMFEGFGFTPTTEVKLILGNQAFNAAAKFFVNNNRIRANFDLTGFAPGVYRAVATIGSAFDTLNNAVTIEQSIAANLTLDISNGRQVIRTGGVKVNGSIINNGSHDAVMVPYVMAGNVLPGVTAVNMNPLVSTLMVSLLNEGVFQETYQYLANNGVPPEVMHANDLDSLRNRQIVAYYKLKVPGHSSTMESIGIPHPPPAFAFQTSAAVLGPLLDSYAFLDSIHSDYRACYSSFLKHEVEKQLNIMVNDANWNNCFTSAFDTLMRTLANVSQNPVYENYGVPMQASFSALLAAMAGCPGSGVPANLGGIQFKRIIQGMMNNWIYLEDIDSLDADCIDTTKQIFSRMMNSNSGNTTARASRIAAGNCSDCPGAQIFPEMCDQCLPFIQAGKIGGKLKVKGHAWGANSAVVGCQEWCENTSKDPNVKYGPGNNGDRKYINHRKDVVYKIDFENLASATAPAAYVEIKDTIDKTVFDIASLKLGIFSWGDSLIVSEPNKQNVSILKNIKPTHPNFLRIDATTDTAAGVITWKFWTVDTVTLQLTTSVTEGFLPPNTDGISGAGFVTYSIAPISTVTNGTMLKNKASIVFDENPPIITNEWEYRIDTLQPSSFVTSLPSIINAPSFIVLWSGTDGHSGVDRYSIYVSVNDSAYKIWKSLTELMSDIFPGQLGNTYKFFSIALDKAGNYEDPPGNAINNPDAFITVTDALPLNLISFNATKSNDNKKVNLQWVTTNEINVSHFELQRSDNGINYSPLARIQARNDPSGGTYTWQDVSPLFKINYYRLRMIDIDSSFKFSGVRIVRFTGKDNIAVFPTVTNDLVFVQSDKEVQFELFNINGVRLLSRNVKDNISIDLSPYPTGVYIIRIASENKYYKIVKQ